MTTAEGSSTVEPRISQRIRFQDRKYNKEGYAEESDGTPTIKEGKEKTETTAHAMTVLRAYDSNNKYDYSVIFIDDKSLRALLLHALAHDPWTSLRTTTLSFVSMFESIVHNWSLLSDLASNDPNKSVVSNLRNELQTGGTSPASNSGWVLAPLVAAGSLEKAVADLQVLLDEVRRTPGLESYFKGVREMQENTKTVSFEYMWTIFPPGELVFSTAFMERPQAFIVKWCSSSYMREGSSKKWILECWTYDWNGTHFNRVPVEFSFEDFKGTKSITSLTCYPLKFHRESSDDANSASNTTSGNSMEQRLMKRAKRFRELCLKKKGRQIYDYQGDLLERGTGVRRIVSRHNVSYMWYRLVGESNVRKDDDHESKSSSSLASPRHRSETKAVTTSRKQRVCIQLAPE